MGKREGGSGNGAVEQNEKERRGSLTLSLESDSSQSQYNRGWPLFSFQPPARYTATATGYVYPAEEASYGPCDSLKSPTTRGQGIHLNGVFTTPDIFLSDNR